ncbi:ESX secretion-associated protein EspG [Lentzea sp. NPDC060358]|uniref:ESX secretion-associated protein EspG n=1 Tax=Lentzea sp. NPDC060358 TaxID=3347103 RepID=UPI003657F947
MSSPASVVLSAVEFAVVWEAQRLPAAHVVLDTRIPSTTHTEKAEVVKRAWESLESRDLARNGRVSPELADWFALLGNHQVAVDLWIWADREIKGLAAAIGDEAILAVHDRDEVWLIQARGTALAEAAVSVAGEMPAGFGRSISLPYDDLVAAAKNVGLDAQRMITALERQGLRLGDAQELAGMLDGISTRGQFGVQRNGQRAGRVVSFHDTHNGRYLRQLKPSSDGRKWCTITPVDNHRLAGSIWELLEEV